MKIFKNNLKLIIGIIIGAILAGGIAYAAISANEIGYTREGTELKNVGDALNDLYAKNYKKEVCFVAQYPLGSYNALSGYMFDLSKGIFYSASSQDVVGQTIKMEWKNDSYVITAMVSGRFLLSWNYDYNIVQCNAGDIIYTFNRQSQTVFTSIGLIE